MALLGRITKIAHSNARIFALSLLLCTPLLVCAMGGRPDTGAAVGYSEPIMDLKAVYDLCRPSMDCDIAPHWEGRLVVLTGYLDPDNIYFKASHPQLPYEKFSVMDGLGRAIEVWPRKTDNEGFYAKLMQRSSNHIVVKGRLKSFRMPVGAGCTLGVRVVIDHVDQIQFIPE